MNLSSLTSADLQRLAKLIALKETHLAEIASIDAELAAFGSPDKPATKRGRPAASAGAAAPKVKRGRKRGGRGGRGQLMEKIISLLKEAGKDGLPVKSIAQSLSLKPQNVHVWFSSTGRKQKEIKKLGPGHFAWVG